MAREWRKLLLIKLPLSPPPLPSPSLPLLHGEGLPVLDASGELVCTRPFPSMPTHFWNDPDGYKYRRAYFSCCSGLFIYIYITCCQYMVKGHLMLAILIICHIYTILHQPTICTAPEASCYLLHLPARRLTITRVCSYTAIDILVR